MSGDVVNTHALTATVFFGVGTAMGCITFPLLLLLSVRSFEAGQKAAERDAIKSTCTCECAP